ncbi:MAG: hypothetical protein J6K26_11325 [Lachnospiraceae bacterium]|nr:hypothetical protein [Lachnospiraceae bacterium]
MNKFINSLERKIGKYAIPNLPMYMIISYAIGYLMQMINPNIISVLSLNPYAIIHGQVWRLVSWVLIPPDTSNLFFTLLMLYFYYSIGTTLERTWGSFYFNYYIFSGMIFTIIGAFCLFGYMQFFQTEQLVAGEMAFQDYMGGVECPWIYGGSYMYSGYATFFSTYYVNMSIFLAFAATYPDMQVLLMFIIPIKVKVLAIIYAVILLIEGINMGIMGLFVIGASMLNFVVFFLSTRKGMHRTMAQRKRQAEYKRKIHNTPPPKIAKHKCAICGRTSEEYPDLEFRFCSKCEGNYEYCQEHLFTHKHIKR